MVICFAKFIRKMTRRMEKIDMEYISNESWERDKDTPNMKIRFLLIGTHYYNALNTAVL